MDDSTAPRFVRLARPGDAAFIAGLQASSTLDLLRAVAPDQDWSSAVGAPQILQAWEQTLALGPTLGSGVLIAEDAGDPVGFASYAEEDEATEIMALEVAGDHRGGGHGSRLLAAIADLARPRHAELRVWIVPQDEARVRFFQSAGFGPGGLLRHLDAGNAILLQHLWHAGLE